MNLDVKKLAEMLMNWHQMDIVYIERFISFKKGFQDSDTLLPDDGKRRREYYPKEPACSAN